MSNTACTIQNAPEALQCELAKISEGWSAQAYIIERALAIRAAAAAGDHDEAERLAIEVEALQIADASKHGAVVDLSAPKGREIWELTAERWAEYLMQAWRRDRYFYPVENCTSDHALGAAHHAFFVQPWSGSCFITAKDIAPVSQPLKVAA
jgi:hypothetical protein